MGFLLLAAGVVLVGSLLGWLSWLRLSALQQDVRALREDVTRLRRMLREGEPSSGDAGPRPSAGRSAVRGARETGATAPSRAATAGPVAESYVSRFAVAWRPLLAKYWMIWLGGACLGLAGIFLVRYSIEQGLLGPAARVAAGIGLALALHGGAEWLRRRHGPHPVLAALAAGGSLSLFAALLAALHLYALLEPGSAFVLLALAALATMWLALCHGPILAAMGILGAFLLPLLVGGGPGGAGIVLAYSLVIAFSALWLMRYVYRPWLWGGVLAGTLGWFLLTLGAPEIHGFRGLYLAVLGYLLLALPRVDRAGADRLLPLSLATLVLAQALAIVVQGFGAGAALNWLPLAAVLLWVAPAWPSLRLHAWLLLLAQCLAWLLHYLEPGAQGWGLVGMPAGEELAFLRYCLASALVYSGLALLNARRGRDLGIWISLAAFAPLCFLALAYSLSTSLAASPQWSLVAAALAGAYLGLAGLLVARRGRDLPAAWLTIAGHAGYSLAAAMWLREASMTLALALQIVSLAWVMRRFALPALGWLLKLVVAAVILRLSLNPWLLSYPSDVHWSLWTYGGSWLCCLVGARLLRQQPELARWALGAALHLFALAVWAELRYWLYDGDVYAGRYDFAEAALNAGIFGALGLIYHWRSRRAASLGVFYRGYGAVLLIFALANYGLILLATALSLSWVEAELILLAYGLPVLLSALAWRCYAPAFRPAAAALTALAAFVFVSLAIRLLWQGTLALDHPPPSSGELYSYSAVWLALAIGALLGGIFWGSRHLHRGGLLLLALVIAKLFLVDLSDLEGLLRVASFLGMGLGLLGVAYLHQRLAPGWKD